jgi:hypothetical protein
MGQNRDYQRLPGSLESRIQSLEEIMSEKASKQSVA